MKGVGWVIDKVGPNRDENRRSIGQHRQPEVGSLTVPIATAKDTEIYKKSPRSDGDQDEATQQVSPAANDSVSRFLQNISRELEERRREKDNIEAEGTICDGTNEKHKKRKESSCSRRRDRRSKYARGSTSVGQLHEGHTHGTHSVDKFSGDDVAMESPVRGSYNVAAAGDSCSKIKGDPERGRSWSPHACREEQMSGGQRRDDSDARSAAEMELFTHDMWESASCRKVLDAIFFGPDCSLSAGKGDEYKELEGEQTLARA